MMASEEISVLRQRLNDAEYCINVLEGKVSYLQAELEGLRHSIDSLWEMKQHQ